MKPPAVGLTLFCLAALSVFARCNARDEASIREPSPRVADADPSSTSCVPGQTFPCMGACGGPLVGYQVCASDGRSYGECVCPEPRVMAPASEQPRGAGGLISLPGDGALGAQSPRSPGPAEDSVGARCRTDADCAPGLDCYAASSDSLGTGGPAGGYCTAPCKEHADCVARDTASACAELAGQSLCARLCESGTAARGARKCLEREDLTCVSVAALGQAAPAPEPQLGICAPVCQSDAACGDRRCDLLTGLCTDEPSAGAPIGSSCETADDCGGGICLRASEQTEPFCSAFCTLGVNGCGFEGSEARIDAACLLSQVPGEGAGDRGLCLELCETADDCEQDGARCVQVPPDGPRICMTPAAAAPEVPNPHGSPAPPSDASVPDAGDFADTTIGLACRDAADCGGGELCLSPDADPFLAGGGPAGGYCSAECQTDAECPNTGSLCARTRGGSFCLRRCVPGDVAACGRDDLACEILPGGASPRGFCRPQCNGDTECGDRVCNPTTGLCEPACVDDSDCAGRVCDIEARRCVQPPPAAP